MSLNQLAKDGALNVLTPGMIFRRYKVFQKYLSNQIFKRSEIFHCKKSLSEVDCVCFCYWLCLSNNYKNLVTVDVSLVFALLFIKNQLKNVFQLFMLLLLGIILVISASHLQQRCARK